MAVYVDKTTTITPKTAEARRCGDQWCHMWADTLDELHEMAQKIGMKRKWFQDREGFPHYDLVPWRRVRALKAGAIERSLREYRRTTHNKESGNV